MHERRERKHKSELSVKEDKIMTVNLATAEENNSLTRF